MPAARPPPAVLAAFAAMVGIGGCNFVAVRFSNMGLPPFGGAALRFAAAAALFLVYVLARRIPLPRGRALLGAALYGALGFGAAYAFMYWALTGVGAGVASVSMALVPLLTLFFASAHGLERVSARGVAGGVLAVAGIALTRASGLGGTVALAFVAALLLAAVAAAESGVLAKFFPRSHPAAANAVGMAVGAAVLALCALAAGERFPVPADSRTWGALAYLVFVGSVGLFAIFLYVLGSWTASAVSYNFVLMPLVAIPLGAALGGETVSTAFLAGAALVLAGVWVGAVGRSPARAARGGP